MKKNDRRRVIVFLLLILFGSSCLISDIGEYELKAVIIAKMLAYVKWPSPVLEKNNTIIFGIVGKSPIISYLNDKIKNYQIDNRPIHLKQITNLQQISNCCVLFISSSELNQLGKIISKTRNQPILTFADTKGFATSGVLINLYRAKDRIKFEINRRAVDRSGLKLSSKLYKLAKIIE